MGTGIGIHIGIHVQVGMGIHVHVGTCTCIGILFAYMCTCILCNVQQCIHIHFLSLCRLHISEVMGVMLKNHILNILVEQLICIVKNFKLLQ